MADKNEIPTLLSNSGQKTSLTIGNETLTLRMGGDANGLHGETVIQTIRHENGTAVTHRVKIENGHLAAFDGKPLGELTLEQQSAALKLQARVHRELGIANTVSVVGDATHEFKKAPAKPAMTKTGYTREP